MLKLLKVLAWILLGFVLCPVLGLVALWSTEPQTASEATKRLTRMHVRSIEHGLELYRLDHGRFPTTAEGLTTLLSPSTDETDGYLRAVDLYDHWCRAYRYTSPGNANPGSYDLCSLGQDGSEGGENEDADICNDRKPE